MKYKYKKLPDFKGSISVDGHTMFLEGVARNLRAKQKEIERLGKRCLDQEKTIDDQKKHIKQQNQYIERCEKEIGYYVRRNMKLLG